MPKKSMSYDHPAYLTPYVLGGRLSGANAHFKFAAFTAMRVKAVTVSVRTVGTSATDAVTAYKVSGTATTTQVIGTMVGTTIASTNVTGTFSLAIGDTVELVKGTDATIDMSCAVEMVATPGADVEA